VGAPSAEPALRGVRDGRRARGARPARGRRGPRAAGRAGGRRTGQSLGDMTGFVVRRIRAGDAALLREVRLRALKTDPESFGSTYKREAAYPGERWRERANADAAGGGVTTLPAPRDGEAVGPVTSGPGGHAPNRDRA